VTLARNIAIIAAIAAIVAFAPGGGNGARAVSTAISMAFLATLAFFGYRTYMENRFTIWTLSETRRGILYGAIGAVVVLFVGSGEMTRTDLGTFLFIALLVAAILAIVRIVTDARKLA